MKLVLEGSKLLFQPDREDQIGPLVRPDIERHDQIVPHPQELEDAEAGQRRHRQRYDQPDEDLDMVGAVNPRALQQLARQADDIIAEKIDRQRQPERCVRDPQAGEGL